MYVCTSPCLVELVMRLLLVLYLFHGSLDMVAELKSLVYAVSLLPIVFVMLVRIDRIGENPPRLRETGEE